MTVREVLLLGNPQLYKISKPMQKRELTQLKPVIADLHDTLMDFRNRYGAGRAIAAPQIGVMKRLIYFHVQNPVVFINPVLDRKSKEKMIVWDDCLCFPDLLVKVKRHKSCRIVFRDLQWREQKLRLEGDLSELLQHEYDHLDGILAVSRALDKHSIALRGRGSKF
jgi:peptide deformylase